MSVSSAEGEGSPPPAIISAAGLEGAVGSPVESSGDTVDASKKTRRVSLSSGGMRVNQPQGYASLPCSVP